MRVDVLAGKCRCGWMRWMTVPYGESQSGALFKKVGQKVASFFKKGDESDTPVDSVFLVGAA